MRLSVKDALRRLAARAPASSAPRQQWEFAPVGAAGLSVGGTSGLSRSTRSS